MDRYHRQTLLPCIGTAGQAKLAASRVLLVGCGALGGIIAEQLVRAGVAWIRLVDRDVVELTNLHRQVLFDEADAAAQRPKVVAAARRLAAINGSVVVDPTLVDLDGGNVEALATTPAGGVVDLIVDGTDNAETRYLLNDVAVKHGVPWVYGGCVGTDGRVMAVRPGVTPCLRCVWPDPPAVGELPTCDTAGVLGPAAAVVASMQSVAALRLLTGQPAEAALTTIDAWTGRFHVVALGERVADCPCCAQRNFAFLNRPLDDRSAVLCGRAAVQVQSGQRHTLEFATLAGRLRAAGRVEQYPYFVRCHLSAEAGLVVTVFSDGRSIVSGTRDLARARSLVSRYVGT